jgi:hypothetical protein
MSERSERISKHSAWRGVHLRASDTTLLRAEGEEMA